MNTFACTFAGILLVLLFLLIGNRHAPMPIHGSVDLAKVQHPRTMPRANREDALIVAIEKDGTIFCGGDQLAPDQLPQRIREELRSGAERTVYIKADGRTKYSNVKEVVDAVRASGVENIAFLVEKGHPPIDPQKTPPN
jgi:biopolymer transport protein ExbD